MINYKTVIFDLDGTLADTASGIYGSYRYALETMGFTLDKDYSFEGAIGSIPLKVFMERFGFNRTNAEEAVCHYKEFYANSGFLDAKPYDGIEGLLARLQIYGYQIGVATLKTEYFAKRMIKQFGLEKYINVIKGMDENSTKTKKDLLIECMAALRVTPSDTILIGDSKYDAEGANEAFIDFAAVLYGYGFHKIEDVPPNVVFIASTPKDLESFLIG